MEDLEGIYADVKSYAVIVLHPAAVCFINQLNLSRFFIF